MAAKPKQKEPVTSSEIQAELDRLIATRDEATAEYLRLEGARDAILLDGSDDDVRQHDEAMGAAKIQAERAALKYERTLPLLDAAEAGEIQARRRSIYEAARKKRDDAAAAIEEYEDAAVRLAKIARRITAGAFAVSEANRDLPEGFAPLDPAEPFNGTPSTYAEYADETALVAIDTRTGQVVNGHDPNDPKIVRELRTTGRRTLINPAGPGRPHRSFLYGLRIPSRQPNTDLF